MYAFCCRKFRSLQSCGKRKTDKVKFYGAQKLCRLQRFIRSKNIAILKQKMVFYGKSAIEYVDQTDAEKGGMLNFAYK